MVVIQKSLEIVGDRCWQLCQFCFCTRFAHTKWTSRIANSYAKVEIASLIFIIVVKAYNVIWGVNAGRPPISYDLCLNWMLMSVTSFIVSLIAVLACRQRTPVWLLPFLVYQSFMFFLCAYFFTGYIRVPSQVQLDFEHDSILGQVPSYEEKIHNANPDALAVFYISLVALVLLIRLFFIRVALGSMFSMFVAGGEAGKEKNGSKDDSEMEAGEEEVGLQTDDGQEKVPLPVDNSTPIITITHIEEDCVTISSDEVRLEVVDACAPDDMVSSDEVWPQVVNAWVPDRYYEAMVRCDEYFNALVPDIFRFDEAMVRCDEVFNA